MRAWVLVLALSVPASASIPAAASANGNAGASAIVGAGTYRAPSPVDAKPVDVASFRLDRELVTNGDYLAFVSAHPEWQRGRIARVFADEGYLAKWKSASELGEAMDDKQPVVEVSWFSARAYCAARGMRLATTAEWEIAAAASDTRADGNADPTWRTHLLALYSAPSPAELPRVGGAPTFWGIRDLHGIVWEWVLDFSSTAAVDCGSSSGGGAAAADFPAFERAAMRSALHGDTTTPNLGFRCAQDLPKDAS